MGRKLADCGDGARFWTPRLGGLFHGDCGRRSLLLLVISGTETVAY